MYINTSKTLSTRRELLKRLVAGGAFYTMSGLYAEALTLSPIVTQGPYYPLADDIPLDKDNDLVQLDDNLTPAAGVVTYVTGRVLDNTGTPVRGALVELWHADREGDYSYSTGVGRNAACDENFAGFGQFLTGESGAFKFRTIKAGLYNGRTRHYHWGVTLPGRTTRACTQTGWNEIAYDLNGTRWATQNSNDNVFSGVSNTEQRASMLLDFNEIAGSAAGEMEAAWDFVSAYTPVEPTYPDAGGFVVSASELVVGPNNTVRYKITIPAYAGYTYEVYGNPTLADLEWKALAFAVSQNGSIDRNKHTATAEGPLDIYIATAAECGYYKVSFRVPGANTGTP